MLPHLKTEKIIHFPRYRKKDHFALGLAIQPNFVTEECGIGLRNVHVEPVVPHQIIDWYKLEHNPEQVIINQ